MRAWAPGNAATLGASGHTGPGILEPNARVHEPADGSFPTCRISIHLPHNTVGGFPQNPSHVLPYTSMLQPWLDAPQPSTSSSASMQSYDDTVSPFLSHAEDREFRDLDTETESEEEGEGEV